MRLREAGWEREIKSSYAERKQDAMRQKDKMGKWLALRITSVPTDSAAWLFSLSWIILRHPYVFRITSFVFRISYFSF